MAGYSYPRSGLRTRSTQTDAPSGEKRTIWHHHVEMWTSVVNSMRREDVFTDVVLVCGEREFPAHRLMLSGASPYFRAMLCHPMTESSSGRIVLKHLDPEALEILLDFLYTGTIKDIADDTELMNALLEASHMLLVDSLFDYVLSVMKQSLNIEHFVDLWNTAELYNQQDIIDDIKEKIAVEEFEALHVSTDFLKLTLYQLKEVLALSNPYFADAAVRAILEWTRADDLQRLDELPKLLKTVKLQLLSDTYLKQLLSSESLVERNSEVFRMLVSVSLETFQWSKSNTLNSRLFCFARNSESPRLSVLFVKERNSWSKPLILSFKLTRHMTCIGYDGAVYFTGCKNLNTEDTDEVWMYSPSKDTCRTILKLKIPVSVAANIDLLGFIYVVGGFDPTNSVPSPVKTVQRFNPETLLFQEVAPTHEVHWFPTVGQLDGKLYITSNSGKTEQYDPSCNQWTSVASIHFPLFGSCASFGESKIFAMPNKKNPCVLEVYDPQTDLWTSLLLPEPKPNKISGRWTVRTQEPDNSVMLVHDKGDDIIHYYNPGCNSWKVLTPISLKSFDFVEFCVVTANHPGDDHVPPFEKNLVGADE